MTSQEWDAIVVGASFGGLAAARALAGSGRVLLIDRQPIGAGQTSACAAPLPLLEWFGGSDAVEQLHGVAVFHLPDGSTRDMPFPYPFATFDYGRLCELLFMGTDATFLQATARGMAGENTVATSRGNHSARVVIDASGWRAVLTPEARPARRSVGVELRLAGTAEGLHFWVHHQAMRNGYAWDFPAGGHRRVGLLTYGTSGRLRQRLEWFLGEQTETAGLHGGSLPARLQAPVAELVFRVGDAAGQCLPLSGEGIRPAMVFGHVAGRLCVEVLTGRMEHADALARYSALVARYRRRYAILSGLQTVLGRVPRSTIRPLYWLFSSGPLAGPALSAYWSVAGQELLELPLDALPRWTKKPGRCAAPRQTGEKERWLSNSG